MPIAQMRKIHENKQKQENIFDFRLNYLVLEYPVLKDTMGNLFRQINHIQGYGKENNRVKCRLNKQETQRDAVHISVMKVDAIISLPNSVFASPVSTSTE